MTRRAAGLLLLAMLAACSRGEDGEAAGGTQGKTAAAVEDTGVRCALAGAEDFAADCTREVSKGLDGETWTVRQPDGGFRRFVLIDGGTRIATADGADEVRTERVGADLEVRVGRDRYLFPAAAAPQGAKSGS